MDVVYNSIATILLITAVGCSSPQPGHKIENASMSAVEQSGSTPSDTIDTYEVQKSEEEWKKLLSGNEYRILRNGGTELPYVNEYYDNKKEGVYYCNACGQPLYLSDTKYESGTGWPSFWKPIRPAAVQEKEDNSLFMTRTEIVCSRCGSHIGHVFNDGPEPTGLRYCMNSQALDFQEADLDSIDPETLPVKEKE